MKHSALGRWISGLRDPRGDALPDGLDPIERDAVDSAVGFSAEHARRYLATDGVDDGWAGPRPILLLYTRGRRSGSWRRNPLLYVDLDGVVHVVGSKGGAPGQPSWFLNLVDAPDVHVRIGASFSPARAEVLTTEERSDAWPLIVERYPMFGEYQESSTRVIPVIRLVIGSE